MYALKKTPDGLVIRGGPNDIEVPVDSEEEAQEVLAIVNKPPVPGPLLDLSREMSPTPFQLGFKDRGHGHGDYVVLDTEGRLVAEMHTIYGHREAVLFAAAWDMLEALRSIDNPSQQVLDAIEKAT